MKFFKDKVNTQTSRGIFITTGMEISVELAAIAGFDWVILDLEHGLGDKSKMLSMVRCLTGTETAPLVRIPVLRDEYVKRALDFGAAGVICPMIKSAKEAEGLVSSMCYPPEGHRGLTASSRASGYGGDFKQYFSQANANLLTIVQIETEEALEDIDAIAAVNEVDVLFIGHSDLSLALGVYGNFDHDKMVKAETDILAAAARHGKTTGLLLKQEMDSTAYSDRGFTFMGMGSDLGCLRSGFKNLLS